MKRYGNLWTSLISFANLRQAADCVRRRKRYRPNVTDFFFHLERELWQLHDELAAQAYEPGPYATFYIHEPKRRLISAAPVRDRVVHHALTGILEPVFEPSFIADSYACRQGKGTHAAVRRVQQFARRFRYVLKTDVRKFFPSLDHAILKELLARKVKDSKVLWLAGRIIDRSNLQEPVLMWFPGDDLLTPGERRRGIPIGNQTSQFFANVYLNPLDHFVCEQVRAGGYVRYVDDLLVFDDDKRRLARTRELIEAFAATLRLRLHEDKTVVFPVTQGIPFLGYRVFPAYRLLSKDNVRRFRRRVRRMQRQYAAGELGLGEVRQRLMSWRGHAAQADTYLLCRRLFASISFQRARAE